MEGITLEKLQVLIEAQTSQFKKEIENVNKQINSLSSNVNKKVNSIKNVFSRVGKTIAALGIAKILKNSIISAMEAIEGENLFETVFGNLSSQMRQWSDDLQNTLGVNAYAARNNAAVLFNIASSMGVVRDEALGLSKDMTLLAEDMASFYNINSDEAFNKIRSGLTGETEPLKALGILVDENTLKQYGYNSSMSNAEKVMVRYKAILAQTSAAQGDLARTLDSPANQLRILKNNLSLLSVELGRAFMPIVQTVLPIINSFVLAITKAVSAVATFMNTLFGTNISASIGGQAASIGALASSTEDYNSALADTGDTAKSTAKEVNRLLGGFDEINTLNKDSSSDGGGASGGSSIPSSGGLVDLGNSEFQQSTNGLESAVNKFKTLFEPVVESFENLKAAIKPLVNNIGIILKWFWDNILVPFTTWTITQVMPQFFNILAGVFKILNPILESFMKLGAWLWDKFLQPIASWTGGVIVSVLTGLAKVLNSIGDWMKNHQGIVDAITISLTAFFAVWKLTELLAFIQTSGGIVAALSNLSKAIKACTVAKIADKVETIQLTALYAKDFILSIPKVTSELASQAKQFAINTSAKITDKAETIYLTTLYAKDFVVSIVKGTAELIKQAAQWVVNTGLKIADTTATIAMNVATAAWNVVAGIATTVTKALGAALAFLTSPIGLVIVAITALIAIGVLLYKNWDVIKAKAIEVWDKIKTKFNEFKNWLGNVFATDWSQRFGFMGNILNRFLANIRNIFNSVKQIFSGIIDFVAGVFTGNWSRAWQGVVSIFSGIMNGLGAVIKAPLNAVISLINGAISGLNKISVSIPSWVPGVGGKTFGVNIPKIPMLAKGGIIDSPTLAMVGEAGKEAVVPLENNTQGLDLLANKLLERLGGTTSTNNSFGSGDLILQIDGSIIGKVALNQLRKMQRQGGINVIPV